MNNTSLDRRGRVLRGVTPEGHPLQALEPAQVGSDYPRSQAEAGYTAGFGAGYRDGMAEAAITVAAETAELRGRLDRAFRAMSASAAELAVRQATDLAACEDGLAAAALDLAEAIIGRELEVAKWPGADALARALALVPPARSAAAHLHPADLCDLDPDMVAAGRDLTLVADPSVEPGGCVVVVGDSRIDAQLGPALARVRAALLSGREL